MYPILPNGIRGALWIGIDKQIDFVQSHLDYFDDEEAHDEMKLSLTTIESNIDEIENSINYMKYTLYHSNTEPLTDRLNKLKETIQMMISNEVS